MDLETKLKDSELRFLEERAREARKLTLETIGAFGMGHVGGCLSIIDALTVLYYKVMNVDPANPKMASRDRFVLSKGHAGPALYSILAMKGYFDPSELKTLNRLGTNLPSHCDRNRTVGVDMTAGSLGQGISAAVGMALAAKLDRKGHRVYCVIGDGESQEGEVWEAAMLAGNHALENLVAFTDNNRQQLDGYTDRLNSLDPLDEKWKSFGWYVQSVDGHDIAKIYEAVCHALKNRGRPSMILLNTIKGKGVSTAEGKENNHHMVFTLGDAERAIEELYA